MELYRFTFIWYDFINLPFTYLSFYVQLDWF